MLPRYQRRMREVNEAVVATYLAGGNTRRIHGALQPLLHGAPLSKSAVSRVVATLKDDLVAWRTRSLTDVETIYLYLDAFALRVRSAGQVVSAPVLDVVGVLPDGHKQLLALEVCSGESTAAWKGCLDDLVARGLRAPLLCIIDGNPGLRRAVGLVWPAAAVRRCCVHKLRNLGRKAPKHALAEIRDVIERLHGEFRRRVKTQGSLPSEDAGIIRLFSLVASGQIRLRRIDGWRKIATVLRQHPAVAA
jgi:putative transposase